MTTLTKREHSPYSIRQLFDAVADVAAYPQFVPFCRAARVKVWESETVFTAELVVAFAHFTERYTSRVTLHPPADDQSEARVDAVMIEGPFDHLTNYWVLRPAADGGTDICLDLNFQFKNRLLRLVADAAFAHVSGKMVQAFLARANALYGPKAGGSGTIA